MSKLQAKAKNSLLDNYSFSEDTSRLIDQISKVSSSISRKQIKSAAKDWVGNYYDLLELFKQSSKGYKAFIVLSNSINNVRLKKTEWLKNLRLILKEYDRLLFKNNKEIKIVRSSSFVNSGRLKDLKKIKSQKYDLLRLLQMCKELNDCYSNENYIASTALTRAILDHVPPIFGAKSFTEIANSRERSIKESLLHLESSSRKIADSYLHIQIRNKEVVPVSNQVDFSQSLDVLLGEIYRILK